MVDAISGMFDELQEAVIKQGNENKEKESNHFDKLKMFFGEDYYVKGIQICQPTIGDILEIGEKKFYSALSPFTNNSTSIRLMLSEFGIDWCKIKDIEVFQILMSGIKNDSEDEETPKENPTLKLIFPNVDIMSFRLETIRKSEDTPPEFCLYSKKLNGILFEDDYMEIAEYIREMLNIHPKVEKAKGKIAKKWMLDEDRMNLQNRPSENDSSLLPLVSSLINHPGFKYNLEQLKQVGIVQFYDAIQRLQIYEGTRALLQGSYSGFCDTSKINKDQFNFMRNIEK